MGAAENRNKSQRMAADLIARGFWHGRRQSSTNAPTEWEKARRGASAEVGSAAYRRLHRRG